jgi:uncharacterized protein
MTAYQLREFHAFEAAGRRFLYLVPSAAVFALDDASEAILTSLRDAPRSTEDLLGSLGGSFEPSVLAEALADLVEVRAVGPQGAPRDSMTAPSPPPDAPLRSMVLNVTSKCNLGCKYCYEYGDDRLVEEGTMPRFMEEQTARESVEFMLGQVKPGDRCLITFFGGETLLNFKLLRSTLDYARARAQEEGKRVDFSLTTNGTLLRADVIEWIAENDVGVTISIDGPREAQNELRVFKNGAPTYDQILPNIKALLARHRSRPVGARVTLTNRNLDVVGIFRHLKDDIGFWEVGFAPVTSSAAAGFGIEGADRDRMLEQFQQLAWEWLDYAAQGRHHGFSNVTETVEEIHKGFAKSHPCGAGFGLLGVATDGNLGLCHRFAGSEEHRMGNVREGIDRAKQAEFLESHHIAHKVDCSSCWARPLCAGGCYHEAHTRHGSTLVPNLHYCDWIRSWTDTCLQVYGALSVRNPDFLRHFES